MLPGIGVCSLAFNISFSAQAHRQHQCNVFCLCAEGQGLKGGNIGRFMHAQGAVDREPVQVHASNGGVDKHNSCLHAEKFNNTHLYPEGLQLVRMLKILLPMGNLYSNAAMHVLEQVLQNHPLRNLSLHRHIPSSPHLPHNLSLSPSPPSSGFLAFGYHVIPYRLNLSRMERALAPKDQIGLTQHAGLQLPLYHRSQGLRPGSKCLPAPHQAAEQAMLRQQDKSWNHPPCSLCPLQTSLRCICSSHNCKGQPPGRAWQRKW